MKIEYCLYVLDVVETGSIRKAAEKRFITQQGLSQAIKSVERELGVEIFNRSGNRIAVTASGQVVVDHLKRIAEDYQDLLVDVSQQDGNIEMDNSTVTIYYTSTIGAMYAPPIVNRLTKRYPRLHIQMFPKKPPELFKLEYTPNTICICGCPTTMAEEQLKDGDGSRKYHRFVKAPLICVASLMSPYAKRKSIDVDDIRSIPFAAFDDEVSMLDDLIGDYRNANLTFMGSDYGLFKDIISSTPSMGFGTAVTEYYFKRPNVVQIPFNANISIDYGCITSAGPLAPVVEDCLELVREELEKFSD